MKQLLSRVAGTFGLRVSSTLLAFATTIILAQILGANGFGTYTYVISWVYLLVIPATLGFDGLLGREIAIYKTKSEWTYLKGIFRWARYLSILVSTGLALLIGFLVWYVNRYDDFPLVIALWFAMLSLPLMAIGRVYRGSMRGLNRIFYGLMPETLFGPLIHLALVGAIALSAPTKLTPSSIIAAYGLATGLSLIAGIGFFNAALPDAAKSAPPKYQRLAWIKAALPFMLIEGINVINSRVDILMLGAINGVEAAGIYAPVNRGAELVVFILMAIYGPLTPKIASLYAKGNLKDLQHILARITLIATMSSGCLAIGLSVFGKFYLMLFGADFVQGYDALVIRCCGKFLYTVVGLSPMVLSMVGYARLTAAISMLGVVINIGLNAVLIPLYTINGAALATTISLIIAGFLSATSVYRKVGINSTLLSFKTSFFKRFQ